jgi:IgA peptidase M64
MKPTVSIVLALALSGAAVSAQSAEMLAFQGAVGPARKAGASVSLVFRVYDAQVDGHLLAGPFRSLGQPTADDEVSATFATADLGSGPLWLEVGAAGVSIPRIRLVPIWYDAADGAGRLTGGRTLLAKAPRPRTRSARVPESTTFLQNGPSSNRIDLVFVGDGYVEAELPTYAIHCQNALNTLFAQEPYATYRNFFNVHVVNVISNESGVDNDPNLGISKDTALDAGFWCGGIERLLCVDVGKAYAAAAAAPQVDHVLVVANSTKYGGAGYTFDDLATFAGGNGAASEVAIHETGHSLGNLADEYDYNDGSSFTGPEPLELNVPYSRRRTWRQRGASGRCG